MRCNLKAVIFDLFETLITEWTHEKYTKIKMALDLNVNYDLFKAEWESLHRVMYLGEYADFTSIYKQYIGLQKFFKND